MALESPAGSGADRRRHARVRMLNRWQVTVWHPNGAATAVIGNLSLSGVALRVPEGFPRVAVGAALLLDVSEPGGGRIGEDVALKVIGEARDARGGRVIRGAFVGDEGPALVRAVWAYGAAERARAA